MLIGPSRKRFLGDICGLPETSERDPATVVCVTAGILVEWVDNAFKRILVPLVILHHSAYIYITLYVFTSRIMGLEFSDMRYLFLEDCILFSYSCCRSLGMHFCSLIIGCWLLSLKSINVLHKFSLMLFQRISHLVNNLDWKQRLCTLYLYFLLFLGRCDVPCCWGSIIAYAMQDLDFQLSPLVVVIHVVIIFVSIHAIAFPDYGMSILQSIPYAHL